MDDMTIGSVEDMKKYCEDKYDNEVEKNRAITGMFYNQLLGDEHARHLHQLLEETRLRRIIYAGLLRAIERGEEERERFLRESMNRGELP